MWPALCSEIIPLWNCCENNIQGSGTVPFGAHPRWVPLPLQIFFPMKFFFPLFSLFVLLGILPSCQKVGDISNAEIISSDREFAIPLAKATATIEDLVENFDSLTFIEIAPGGIIHLRYKGDVLTQRADTFLLAARDSVPPFLPILDTVFALPFSSPDQLEVDFAIYKTGRVSLGVKSDHVGPVDLTVRLPQTTKDGVPFELNYPFVGPTDGLFFGINFSAGDGVVEDMAGYFLEPVNDSIFVEYEAYDEFGERLLMDTLFLVNENIYFGYLEGFLGDFQHNGTRDFIPIDFFESWTQGDVWFEEPSIFINIENAFGVPTRSVIDLFDIVTVDSQRIPLRSQFIDDAESGIDFPYPTVPGEVAFQTFEFNVENSNIDTVLGSRPIGLDYDVDARMNPDNDPSIRGFITDSSYYNIQVEVDLPLYGRASGFAVTDTFEVDFADFNDIKEGVIKIVSDNGMPLDIVAQIFFLNNDNEAIDSLFDERIRLVSAAMIDGGGNVVAPTTETVFAPIDAAHFDRIRSAKIMALEAQFSTSGNGQVSVRATQGQEAEIRMGLRLKQ